MCQIESAWTLEECRFWCYPGRRSNIETLCYTAVVVCYTGVSNSVFGSRLFSSVQEGSKLRVVFNKTAT